MRLKNRTSRDAPTAQNLINFNSFSPQYRGDIKSNVRMMIRRLLRNRRFRVFAGVYLGLWLLTATLGNFQIDRRFDQDFSHGTRSLGSHELVEIERIEQLYVRDLMDPRNKPLFPSNNGLFRYRSWGVAIMPFLVVDEIGAVFAPLGGFGGLRVNFWFFGAVLSVPVYSYWNV